MVRIHMKLNSKKKTASHSFNYSEKVAIKLSQLNNYNWFKRLQFSYTVKFISLLVKAIFGHRIYYANKSMLVNLAPDRGVIFVGNHRTFFDLWLTMTFLRQKNTRWANQ